MLTRVVHTELLARAAAIHSCGVHCLMFLRGSLVAMAAVAMLVATSCGGNGANAPALVSIGAGLEGQNGLHATVYARGIPHMSAFAFDSAGRLWVTRSGATAHGADGVYLVRRAGATPSKVISGIGGPLGLAWLKGRLYVSSLEGVVRFDSLSRDRFLRRTTILRGPAVGAENNNLVVAPDGRLVLGVSAPCDHCARLPRYSGAIVSFRPDGSGLRFVAKRVRAAYGLVYLDGVLYASMNQRDDLGARTPGDWLAVVTDGQDWGFPSCYGQGGPPCSGVPSPLAVLDAHAAAGGVAISNSHALVAEWSFGKVLSVALEQNRGAVHTYVTGLQHPLPLITTDTGAVLLGDWGTGIIYRITTA
jgi:glucose/arabinose dehydrogenase